MSIGIYDRAGKQIGAWRHDGQLFLAGQRRLVAQATCGCPCHREAGPLATLTAEEQAFLPRNDPAWTAAAPGGLQTQRNGTAPAAADGFLPANDPQGD